MTSCHDDCIHACFWCRCHGAWQSLLSWILVVVIIVVVVMDFVGVIIIVVDFVVVVVVVETEAALCCVSEFSLCTGSCDMDQKDHL